MLDQHSDPDLTVAQPVTDDALPAVRASQTRPYPGQTNVGGQPGTYSPATGTYAYTAVNGGADNLNFAATSQVDVNVDISATAETLSLPATLSASVADDQGKPVSATYTGNGYSVSKTERITPSTAPLAQWNNGEHNVQLIARIRGDNQTELCWNYTLPNTERRYCNIWEVPANWTAGQQLTHLGYYIDDVRNNEHRYWQRNK